MDWERLATEADCHLISADDTWDEYLNEEKANLRTAEENDRLHKLHAFHRQMAIAKYLGAIVNHNKDLDNKVDNNSTTD